MVKYDPTKTKILIRSYEQQIRKLITRFWKNVKPRILEMYSENKTRVEESSTYVEREKKQLSAVTDIETVLDTYEYQYIQTMLKPVIEKYTRHVYEKAGAKATREIQRLGFEVHFDLLPRDYEAISVMVDHQFAELRNVSGFMKKELLRVLSTGMLEGQSVQKMGKALQERVNISKKRASMIVRTETIRSYNSAAANQYKKAGVTQWRWITAFDDRTCDVCAGYDGQVFQFGDPQPPAHPNCRCSIAAVVEKK